MGWDCFRRTGLLYFVSFRRVFLLLGFVSAPLFCILFILQLGGYAFASLSPSSFPLEDYAEEKMKKTFFGAVAKERGKKVEVLPGERRNWSFPFPFALQPRRGTPIDSTLSFLIYTVSSHFFGGAAGKKQKETGEEQRTQEDRVKLTDLLFLPSLSPFSAFNLPASPLLP